MSDADLRRVRDDLDTIRQAAGLALPFRWVDVWLTLALAPAGLLLSAWASFGPAEYLAFGLMPLLFVALAASVRHLRRPAAEPATRHETRFGTVATLAIVGGLAAFFLWIRQAGLVTGPAGAVACFFVGIVCLVIGLTAPARRVYFAGAVALIPFGMVVPWCDNQSTVTAVGGLAVALAGLTAAAILAWQLRTSQRAT